MQSDGHDSILKRLLLSSRLHRLLPICIAALFFLKAVVFFVRAARVIAYPYEWSTMDGYFVYYGLRLISGDPIYFQFKSLMMPFEYVPVYAAAIGALAKIFGPGVWYERSFSVLCSVGVAALIVRAVHRRTDNRIAAAGAGLAFFAAASLSVWYIVRGIDIFAVFLALAAVTIVAEAEEDSRFTIVLAMGLFVVAFYSKQTTVFPAAAAIAFVFFRNPKKALIMGAGFGLTVIGIFYLLEWFSGGWFYESAFLTTAKNPYYCFLLWDIFRKFFLSLFIIFPVALLQAFRGVSRRPDIWTLYFVFTLLSALLAGKIGAALSYFIPLFSATCICFGFFLGDSVLFEKRAKVYLAVMLLLLVQAGFFFKDIIPVPSRAHYQQARLLDEHIKRNPGRLLTERIDSFAVLNERELNIEAVQLPILVMRGKFDQGKLVRALKGRRFSLVLYSGNYFGGLPPVKKAIFEHYAVVEEVRLGLFYGETTFLVMVPR